MSNSNKQKIYLVSFADTRLGISICRFKQQAEAMHIFDDIFIYTEASLPLSFKEDFKDRLYDKPGSHSTTGYNNKLTSKSEFVPTTGFGYWCWKPKVILMALEQIQENDLLLYLDIGFEFNRNNKDELVDMFKQTDEKGFIGLLHHPIIKKHIKGDTLRYFGLENDEIFLNSNLLASGMIFMKKMQNSVDIIKEWMDIYYTNFNLVDDSPSIIENKDCVRHLYEQTTLACILYKRGHKHFFSQDFYNERYKHALLVRRNKIFLSNSVETNEYFNSLFITYPSKNGYDAKAFVEDFIDKYKLFQKNEQELKAQLQKVKDTLNAQIDTLNNKINSLPMQEQTLKVENLKQDLIIKQLEAKKLEKELGIILENIPEIKSLKEALSKKENDINNLDINHKKALTSQELEIKSLKEALFKKEKDISSLEINYQKAKNIKNHLSYKLGTAFIKAHKSWYKGGYIKFIFEAIKIKKEHNKAKI